jgi:DNA-binding NarL/FixJ family response regulator
MSKTRVLVVDDHPFFLAGLVQWLDRQPTLTCCGQAGSVAEARRAVQELQPDVIFMDLRLSDGDGLELIRELTSAQPQLRIVALSQFDEQVYAHRALLAGARGYLMKSEATETALAAVQMVLRGGTYVSRSVAAQLLENLFPDPVCPIPQIARLSDRELQVFQLLGSGSSVRQISARLKISPKTVETYREHLKEKLGAKDSEILRQLAANWVTTGQLPDQRPRT